MNRRNFINDSLKAIAAFAVAPLALLIGKDKEPKKEDLKGWLTIIEDQCYEDLDRDFKEYVGCKDLFISKNRDMFFANKMTHAYDAQRYLIKRNML